MTSAPEALWQMSLTEAAAALRSGTVSSLALTESMLMRIAALDPQLHAYATVLEEEACRQARQRDHEAAAGRWRGVLHGIPIAVKDLCDTAGVVTQGGMPLHRHRVPARNATVITRLNKAGAVLLGKLQMTEGAFSAHHPDIAVPVNPWGDELWSGVSSSGSAVALAAGLCFGALGSDTLGSIRFPSAVNGVTGLKPTFGRVSVAGVMPLSPSMDHVGPMARSAADVAALYSAIAGADPEDPLTLSAPIPDLDEALNAGIAGLRIGIDHALIETHADAASVHATLQASRQLVAQGAREMAITLPSLRQVSIDALELVKAELALVHAATWPSQRQAYGPVLDSLIEAGSRIDAATIAAIRERREAFAAQMVALFETVDVLIMPALNVAAPQIAELARQNTNLDERLARLLYTAPINMSRNPSLTLPGGFTPQGAPVGFQIVGACLDEARVLAAGHAFQQATDWHRRHPAVAPTN